MHTRHRITTLVVLATALAAVLMTGCNDDENARVANVAMEAARQQADQNKEMAKVNQTVATATERLVAADAEARKEIVTVHRDIQAERQGFNAQRDQLEAERKSIARQRHTESWVGPVILSSGTIVVAALAIGFCLLLVFGLRNSDAADTELNELLVRELASEGSGILPQLTRLSELPAIENSQADESPAAALPSPDK